MEMLEDRMPQLDREVSHLDCTSMELTQLFNVHKMDLEMIRKWPQNHLSEGLFSISQDSLTMRFWPGIFLAPKGCTYNLLVVPTWYWPEPRC